MSSTSTRREMPPEHYQQAAEAELALFGSCLVAPTTLDETAGIVGGYAYHDSALGRAYDLITDLHQSGRPIGDATLLAAELRKAGLLDHIGGTAFIGRSVQQGFGSHAVYYAQQVRELWQRRQLHATFSAGMRDCEGLERDPREIGQAVEAQLAVASEVSDGDTVDCDAMITDALHELEQARLRGRTIGLPTGLPSIDLAIGGFYRGDLIVLAARPSIGKSALALDLAVRVAIRQRPVLFVSLEMSGRQIAHRLLNRETGISVRRIQSNQLDASEAAEIEQARERLRGLPLRAMVSTRATVAAIRSRARVEIAQGGCELVVVDYLGLLTIPQSRMSLYERTTELSRSLKALAIELDRPILSLCQLNREAAKSGGLPTLEHLRDSGAIEQDADTVLLLHRQDRETTAATLDIAKQRQGQVGCIDLTFVPERMTFVEREIEYREWAG